jgi:curved DNA-binding protein CbpA
LASLYSILELPVFSDTTEVKKSFKRLALKYHPDINKTDDSAEEKFKRINQAYQILSDEAKKRRYDGILRYQINKPQSLKKAPSYKYKTTPNYAYKQTPKPKRKTSLIYNALAIGLFGIGMILFQVITEINKKRLENNYENSIELRAELIDKSKKAFERGELRNAMSLLSQIKFNTSDKDLYDLKQRYLHFSDSLSNELVLRDHFDSALNYLDFLIEYRVKVDESVYKRISKCYRLKGQHNNAIDLMQRLIMVNPNHLVAHKELAKIYQYDLGDYQTSLGHYEKATKIIVKNYVDYYGKAYIAIINPNNHSDGDVEVFLEKSKIYYNINEIDSSLYSSRWAAFLEPSNAEAHLIQGLCWLKKGENYKACSAFEKANQSNGIIPQLDSLMSVSCIN